MLRIVLGFALAGVALWVVYGRGSELQTSSLDDLRWEWLLPAVVVEGASLVSFALMQTRLLATGAVSAPAGPMTGVTLGTQAISNSFPGGPALALAYSFRWYRRFGADDSLAGWTLIGVAIGASLSLALVAAGGVALARNKGVDLDLVPVVVVVLLLSVGTAVLFVKQEWMLSIARRLVRRRHARHEPGLGAGELHHPPGAERRHAGLLYRATVVIDRLGAFRLGWRGLATVVGWGLGTWLLDCTCFALAFLAVGATIPWGALLLAYGAGQLAANLPITPGGLGVVEGSIVGALTYFGGTSTKNIVAAVFIYRLISFWLELIVGWSSVGILAVRVRRGRWPLRRRDALGAPPEPLPLEGAVPGAATGAEGAEGAGAPDSSLAGVMTSRLETPHEEGNG